jgi:hypothetical protein
MTSTGPPLVREDFQVEYAPMENAMRSGECDGPRGSVPVIDCGEAPAEELVLFLPGVTNAFQLLVTGKMEPLEHREYFGLTSLPRIVSYILSRR